MNRYIPIVLKIVLLLVAVMIADVMLAQVAPPPPPPPPGGGVPIDGGLVFLLVAGTAYGAKKVYENNKDVNTDI